MLHVSTPDTHNHTINQHLRKHFQQLTVLETYLFSMSSTDQAWRWSKTLASDGDICNNENMLQLETTKTSISMWMNPYSNWWHETSIRPQQIQWHVSLDLSVTEMVVLSFNSNTGNQPNKTRQETKMGDKSICFLPYCQERATSTYITVSVSTGFKFV